VIVISDSQYGYQLRGDSIFNGHARRVFLT